MKWIKYDKIAVHEAGLSSTQILIPSFDFMQDVGFYPFLGPRLAVQNLAATGGMRSRRSIETVCCLFGGTKTGTVWIRT